MFSFTTARKYSFSALLQQGEETMLLMILTRRHIRYLADIERDCFSGQFQQIWLHRYRKACDHATGGLITDFTWSHFFQKAGKKMTKAENISNRPTSMFQDRNHLPKSVIKA